RNLYCCLLGNPQNLDLSTWLDVPPAESPFARAMQCASHVLIIPNSTIGIYTRLWCVYEAYLGTKYQKTCIMPMRPRASAQCSTLLRIRGAIAGFEHEVEKTIQILTQAGAYNDSLHRAFQSGTSIAGLGTPKFRWHFAPLLEYLPEQQKLSARLAPGSNAWLAVRWPWRVRGRQVELLRESSHVLEFCSSSSRQSLRDPAEKPVNVEGETATTGRPTGPWHEAKALQVCFVNFDKNEVLLDLPPEASREPNWVPVLIASGLWSGREEPATVHLRWRLRAGLRELGATNPALHFSAATGPLRTSIAAPASPYLRLAVPDSRASRLTGWLRWTAWLGSEKHQFCYRILGKSKKKRHVQ
ncbi:unnamed protein product, partial [Effrenium voratum]